MRSTSLHPRSTVFDVRGVALSLMTATVGMLAVVTNVLWGTAYPNATATSSQPSVSPASYLQARPFDALALLTFSLSAENPDSVDVARRQRTLLIASQLAPNDSDVVKARATLALQRGEVLAGLNHVARLASISPSDRSASLDTLLSAATRIEWPRFIEGQLQEKWPLAEALLVAACAKLSGDQLLGLAAAVSRSVNVSTQTAACVTRKLVAENRAPDARAFWLGTLRPLPPVIGHVFNGDLSLAMGDNPFNWSLADGGEFRDGFRAGLVDIESPGRKARALQVRFNGRRVNSWLVEQALAIPSGNYRLRYATRQTGFSGAESVHWVFRCDPAGAVLDQRVEPAAALADGWTILSATFTIPEACKGQSIRLELSSRLQQLTGANATVALSGIEVARMGLR